MMRTLWQLIAFFSISLILTILLYWSVSRSSEAGTKLINSSSPSLSAQVTDEIQQGQDILLNGRRFSVAWSQWQQGDSLRTGISDTGAMQLLGLELLSSDRPDLQPVRWFSSENRPSLPILARFIAQYRYLDVTELIQLAGGQIRTRGNTLEVSVPPAQIDNIRSGNQNWGKRIVVDLNRPAFWQVSQVPSEGVVMVSGVASPSLLAGFKEVTASSFSRNIDEDDLGGGGNQSVNSQLFSLENTGNFTKIKVALPTSHRLSVSSLANPNRLIIDVRPDVLTQREIVWTQGIIWRQQAINLRQGLRESVFPVTWLEIDPKSPNISLKPITSNPNSQQGTASLVTTARTWQVAAAINGGFFNRDNQLPLGAIRQDNRWLSSPILNRGAIAWNPQGQVIMSRLILQETLITASGNRFPLASLNSGYVQSGLSRYTPQWGQTYTTLTDNEIIFAVQNKRVIGQKVAGKVGSGIFPIPIDGYLLISRKNAVSPNLLPIGTPINVESSTIPAEFNQYANILGAGPLLVQNRRIVLNAAAEQFSKAFQQQQASRSAIGMTERRTLLLVAVHNRIGGRGATLGEMAQLMQQIGAVDALNLDGGSSTSLVLGGQLIDRSPVTAARVHNGIGVFVRP